MVLVCISDTHNRHKSITLPEGDILISSGDISTHGNRTQVTDFCEWFGSHPHTYKILVAGNHDYLFERSPEEAKAICLANGIIYLEDRGVTLEGFKFWGMPTTPWHNDWAFNRARNEAARELYKVDLCKNHTDLIPNDTDVLITHGPPYDILDEVLRVDGSSSGRYVGCEDLKEAVQRVRPDVHIFGHIHSGHGEKLIDGTQYLNVSIVDEMYYPSYEPTIYELEK